MLPQPYSRLVSYAHAIETAGLPRHCARPDMYLVTTATGGGEVWRLRNGAGWPWLFASASGERGFNAGTYTLL